MIEDISDACRDGVSKPDAVVVGSGIAGCEVALRLARSGRRVILLESGRRVFDERLQSLNDLIFEAKAHRARDADATYHRYLPPEMRGVSRLRQFGGTSNLWTGKWKHMQASDFDARSWVPNSGWPIGLEALLPHYREAARDYGFGDFEAEARRPELDALRRTVEAHGIKVTSFYWEKVPTRTAARFGSEMERQASLRVILGATVTDLHLGPGDRAGRRRVSEVTAMGLEGQKIRFQAEQVILATGALETARLLLASDDAQPGGIGNQNGLVGRFYTDHLKHHDGYLAIGPLAQRFARELQYAPKPRFCVCFALDDRVQAELELLEHVVYLKPEYVRGTLDALGRRIAGHTLARDGNGRPFRYKVKFVSEQVPHAESRARLSDERDAFGQRRLILDWAFTALDHTAVSEAARVCVERFAQAGLGRLDFGSSPPSVDSCTDAAHQMGTTRMGRTPREGVVDTDCRVFGTENLYVAGSAVFPSCPSYSPTFTILALARRLATHLLETTRVAV
jgi:choline dehydrogenase-like flavoprotein